MSRDRNEQYRENYWRLRRVGFNADEIVAIKFRSKEKIDQIVKWAESYQPTFEEFKREKEKIVKHKDYIPKKEE